MKKIMRQIAKYNNCVFSMSLWGDNINGQYVILVEYEETPDDEVGYKVYKLEGDLKEVFKTYEDMIKVMKSKANHAEE